MATQEIEADFARLMAARSTGQLLALLRARHDYLPAAIAAAVAELQRREVSGFEVTNALDEGLEAAQAHVQSAQLPLSRAWMVFWLLLPFLALTPLGAWHFRRHVAAGHRRRSVMFLEAATIGFMGYMIGFMLIMYWR
jgi:hypothetical protein